MAQITNYTTLVAALQAWAERSGDSVYVGQIDAFIGLAEAQFNRWLSNYEMEVTTTITTNDNGVGTLPADFNTMRSVFYPQWGALKQVSLDAANFLDPMLVSGVPYRYAISGTTFTVIPLKAVALTVTYVANLTGLSGSNATNWVMTNCPDGYLWECMAQGEAFNGNFDAANSFDLKAKTILDEQMAQDTMATYGRAEMTLRIPMGANNSEGGP